MYGFRQRFSVWRSGLRMPPLLQVPCATNLQTIACARSDAPMIFEGCGWLSANARIDSKDLMLQVLKFGSPKDGYLCILIWPPKLPLGPRAKTCSLGWVQHPLTDFNCCESLAAAQGSLPLREFQLLEFCKWVRLAVPLLLHKKKRTMSLFSAGIFVPHPGNLRRNYWQLWQQAAALFDMM